MLISSCAFFNQIEEQILECLAWSHDSPLWYSIQQAGSVPSCEDVSLPYQTESVHTTQNLLASPIIHPRVQRICGEEGAARRGELQHHFYFPSMSVFPKKQVKFVEFFKSLVTTFPWIVICHISTIFTP